MSTTSETYRERGWSLANEGNWQLATKAFREAVHHAPECGSTWNDLGCSLIKAEQPLKAIKCLRNAIKYGNPRASKTWLHLGNAYFQTCRLETALACTENSIKLDPETANAHRLHASILTRLGNISEAETSCKRAIALSPNPKSRLQHGILQLTQGNYSDGWELYEARHEVVETDWSLFESERWNGEPLDGKTIIVLAEQGIGDTIQFARYTRLLKERFQCTVWFFCREELLPLMKTLPGVDRWFGNRQPPPACDYYLPAMSLPRVLGTTLDRIPQSTPYLSADPVLTACWQKRLQSLGGDLRIGVVWKGNSNHEGDRFRSCKLRDLAPLARWSNISWINLQQPDDADDLQCAKGLLEFTDLGTDIDQEHGVFQDTAAILKNIDLLITVDTANAHLAGALGVPVWLAISEGADWRWLLDRNDSPWYPSIKLFRQKTAGDWTSVFQQMADQLPSLSNRLAPKQPSEYVLGKSESSEMVAARHGIFTYNPNDIYVGRSMKHYGEWSEDEVNVLCQMLRKDCVVVEAGSNIGTHTVPLARCVGELGHVYAFEPQRLMFQNLCANVTLNGLTNVDCQMKAVGNEIGRVFYPAMDASQAMNYSGIAMDPEKGECSAELTTIDHLNLGRCDLIKADVQGSERAVVLGATETIKQFKPALYLENEESDKSEDLLKTVWDFGYDAYWHTPKLYSPNNFFANQTNHFGDTISANILCVHRSRDITLNGFSKIAETALSH